MGDIAWIIALLQDKKDMLHSMCILVADLRKTRDDFINSNFTFQTS